MLKLGLLKEDSGHESLNYQEISVDYKSLEKLSSE